MTGISFGVFSSHIKHLESLLDDETIPWKPLIIQLLLAVYAFETYVSYRQYRLYSQPAPPAELAKHVDLETYQKSQAYGQDKAKYKFVKDVADLGSMLAVVHYDVYAAVWTYSSYVVHKCNLPLTEVSFLFTFHLFRY